MGNGEVSMRPSIWGEGSGISALTPQQDGPQLKSGLPLQGRGGGLQGRSTPSVGLAVPSMLFLLRPSALALIQTPLLTLQPCSLVSSHPRWLLSYPALTCPETLASWLLSPLISPEPKSLLPLLVGTMDHKLGPPDLSFPRDLGVQVPSFNFLILLTLRGSQSDTQQRLRQLL